MPTVKVDSKRSARVAIAAALTAVFLNACGGGGGGTTPSPSSATNQDTTFGPVTWTMTWATASTTSSGSRNATYLAPTARSASITILSTGSQLAILGSGTGVQYLNAPSTTSTFTAPLGLDTFEIKTYDEQNGQGNALSVADVTVTVTHANTSLLTTTLNGVIASLKGALSYPIGTSFANGTAAIATLTITAFDADGNAILEPIGSSDFNTPIHLSVAKTNPSDAGTFSLGTSLLQTTTATSASTSVTYNGGLVTSSTPATITISATGATSLAIPIAMSGVATPPPSPSPTPIATPTPFQTPTPLPTQSPELLIVPSSVSAPYVLPSAPGVNALVAAPGATFIAPLSTISANAALSTGGVITLPALPPIAGTPLYYVQFAATNGTNIGAVATYPGPTVLTFTGGFLAPLFSTNASCYLAFYDAANPAAGWLLAAVGPSTVVSGPFSQTLTFTIPQSFTFNAGDTYGMALYHT